MNKDIVLLKELANEKKLLIVEDDREVINSLERLLGNFFKKIFTATNALDAIEIYEREKVDSDILIITDINLGRKSGLDLTCHIKRNNSQQRVIAISGTEERSVFIDSIQCGIDRFVLKPIDNDTLFEALIFVLRRMEYDRELEKNRKLLEESKEYAIRLLEEQEIFLKNAIHEIYTPLTVIITNIDLLRMNAIENESLDAIEAGSRMIQNSYEDMTYLMKHEHMVYEKRDIDLVKFMTQRKKYFNCIAEVNGLTLSMRIGRSNIILPKFSEFKLARLIDNTLSNAIKYSYRPSEISITVGMDDAKMFFEIRNHGPVIEDKEKIFQRFYRELHYKGGYGLGLSIVAKICEEEDIEIQLSSTKQRGTSFRYLFKNNINSQLFNKNNIN
ncbi:hybrid sensor histidine kinase/response regulator [bacterium]|nr:hybrid sensor histidine kinase/response regulator [bacterium]MBU1884352.1 hybrid sensor histidine kinase/response regulator [bacterium]